MRPEFEKYYDTVFNLLQNNFNYKELIESNPVKIKQKDGTITISDNIGLSHVKNFSFELDVDDAVLFPNLMQTAKKNNIVLV